MSLDLNKTVKWKKMLSEELPPNEVHRTLKIIIFFNTLKWRTQTIDEYKKTYRRL